MCCAFFNAGGLLKKIVCWANMSALAGLNAARRSFTQRDAVTQEVEEDVFQEDFSLPVGLDHTKLAAVL